MDKRFTFIVAQRMGQRVSHCRRKGLTDMFPPVVPNQAVTPSDMMEMMSHGMAISSQMLGNMYDGDNNPSWVIPPENVRGVDPADLWQLKRSTKAKVRAAVAKDVESYG